MGLFYVPKLAGEPTHRPMVRTSPVRDNYPCLIDTVLKRHAQQGDPIEPNDAFFLFNTSTARALAWLLGPFAKKEKVAKACRGKIRVHLGWPPPLGMLEPEEWDR